MSKVELTVQERLALGRFLDAYQEEWEASAFMTGMTLMDAEETRKKLQEQ